MENYTLFSEMLTVLLIVLKITGVSDIPWWLCLAPAALPFVFAFLSLVIIKQLVKIADKNDELF